MILHPFLYRADAVNVVLLSGAKGTDSPHGQIQVSLQGGNVL